MTTGVYNSANRLLLTGRLDLETGALTVLLLRESYVPDADQSTLADVEAHEVVAPGYNRKTLTGQRVETADGAEHLFADDVVWENASIAATHYVIARGDDLVGWCRSEAPVISTNGRFSIEWTEAGVLRLGNV